MRLAFAATRIGLAAILALGAAGMARAGTWEDIEQFFADARMDKPKPPQIEQGLSQVRSEHYSDAMATLDPMAALDDRDALYQTGRMYEEDQGRQPQALDEHDRLAEAARRYARAAELGHADAAYRLGRITLRGVGVARDPFAAATLLYQAAVADHGKAQYELGSLLAAGTGVQQDEYAALSWYLIAAQRNDVSPAEPAAEALCQRLRRQLDLAAQKRLMLERPGERFRPIYTKSGGEDRFAVMPARIQAAMDVAVDFEPPGREGQRGKPSMPNWRCFTGQPES